MPYFDQDASTPIQLLTRVCNRDNWIETKGGGKEGRTTLWQKKGIMEDKGHKSS